MKKTLLILILFIGFISFSQKSKFATYRVSQHETISSIARKLGITPYDLLKLNPDAKDGINIDEVLIVPNKNYIEKKIVATQSTTVLIKPKDSIVDGFIYHTVKPLETLYSLSRKFDISKRKVRRLNKLNKKCDISVGQVLKFPTKLKNTVSKVEVIEKTVEEPIKGDFFIYVVKPHDTYYSLTRDYKVSEEILKSINKNLTDGLKAGLVIKIPKMNEKVVNNGIDSVLKDTILINQEPQYIIHTVKEKEGFFRLKQLYNVNEEELIEANPELINGLKLGMEIKIPTKLDEASMVEGDIQDKLLNVVMMLPFNADKEISFSDDSNKSKLLNKVTDFYLGSLMALDSLKKKGLSVNVKVFDTKNSDFVVNSILNSYDFSNVNVVIAPIRKSHFKLVASKLEASNIPIISISRNDYNVLGLKNSIQNVPTNNMLRDSMIDYILSNVTNQNIVIVAEEIKPDEVGNVKEIERIKSKLMKNDSINNVSVIRMKDGYFKRELFEDNIKEDKENWVILVSKDKKVTSNTVDNLAVFSDKFKITLSSLMKPENMDIVKGAYKMKSKYLNKLNFQYPIANFIDSDNYQIIDFNTKYKVKYNCLPSELSYKGFDTTYDALIRLANTNDSSQAFNLGKSTRLISKFNFKQNNSKSFSNHGVFIVRYNDYKLEKIK